MSFSWIENAISVMKKTHISAACLCNRSQSFASNHFGRVYQAILAPVLVEITFVFFSNSVIFDVRKAHNVCLISELKR